MFCPNCGKEIDNSTNFCGNCGAKNQTHSSQTKTYDKTASKNITPLLLGKTASIIVNKKHKNQLTIILISPLVSIILLLLAKIQIGAYGMQFAEFGIFDISKIQRQFSDSFRAEGRTHNTITSSGVSLMPLLILLFVITPVIIMYIKALYNVYLSACGRESSYPLKLKSLTVIQITHTVFFLISMVPLIFAFNYLDDKIRDSGTYSLNAFGWLYIIASIAIIVLLFKMKSKYKRGELL